MEASDALSADITIQSSTSTFEVVEAVRAWTSPLGAEHCVVVGPAGSGRSHILEAAANLVSTRSAVRFSPQDADWYGQLPGIDPGAAVLVDDLDRYDDRFRKALFKQCADRRARVLAASRSFDGRLARLFETALGAAHVCRLQPLHLRLEDVQEFMSRWLVAQRLDDVAAGEAAETVALIASLRLPRAFVDLTAILSRLASTGYVFSEPIRAYAWVDSYQYVLGDSRATPRVVLVEGETEAIYFRWVAELALGTVDAELSVDPCGSASKVVERSIACRNEGRAAVALFDFDKLGKKYYDDLKGWGHPCLTLPATFDPLEHGAPDHVLQVVEIEDLLPIESLERFFDETKRSPEVGIFMPERGLKRLVPHADDKLALAKWASATLGVAEASKFLKIYNDLRALLSVSPLSFPAT